LSELERRSTHEPPQLDWPAGHAASSQLPDWHTAPVAQAWSQAPQCRLLACTSTQDAPQATSPGAHVVAQCPCEQIVPAPHASPHEPQCRESLVLSTQAVPQVVSPCSQVAVSVPVGPQPIAMARSADASGKAGERRITVPSPDGVTCLGRGCERPEPRSRRSKERRGGTARAQRPRFPSPAPRPCGRAPARFVHHCECFPCVAGSLAGTRRARARAR
jgi:hypothetical protein